MLPPPILIPLVSAIGYALSAIFLKRALEDGAGRWRVTFICNMVMAVGYQACWVLRTQPFSRIGALHAALTACVAFGGQTGLFLALNRGDVSVVAPILGTKVIWVAVFSTVLVGQAPTGLVWLAVLATALGAAILGYQPGRQPRHVALSVGTALTTSGLFGLSDVLFQKYAPQWGFGSFEPTMYFFLGVLSLSYLPLMRGEEGKAPGWLGAGAVLLAAQAVVMAYAIATYGGVTKLNVLYNSRGLWSVVLVWRFGHWLGSTEREGETVMMLRRMGRAEGC